MPVPGVVAAYLVLVQANLAFRGLEAFLDRPAGAGHTTGELAYYRCWAPQPVLLGELVRVAGTRWAVEECFQVAKSHVGLDHYQVRGWTPWHRFTTLAMLALAVLAAITAHATHDPPAPHCAGAHEPIALTVAEIRRLLTALVLVPARAIGHLLDWSTWRR